ncbi:hypothetical protein BX600DRAFT_499475 [Xylariales sp. PMI_506]|nr:hypothetical protein BX600DRAFT_499475 [Xylariales sp. PMI_506]
MTIDTVQPTEKLPQKLQNDTRDVADLWKDALKSYKGIVGFDLEHQYQNVGAMVAAGTEEMNNFHKFRHDKKKVDKLRSFFSANLDLLEKGANQVISAAAPAFPPAAAIGTALTYILKACRAVSADYDIVTVFFADMNGFLKRIVILEARLPQNREYQNCLMDVFTSFLTMCGYAHKYIELGRFKKWIGNLLNGQDGDLSGARKGMDQRLDNLRQATEFAILGNTEENKKMTAELNENQQQHTQMLEEQKEVLNSIQEDTKVIRDDLSKLLKAFSDQKHERESSSKDKNKLPAGTQNKPPSANRIRNSLPAVADETHEYLILKETMVADTCTWLFQEASWEAWLAQKDTSPTFLGIVGAPGTGKSHIAASIVDKLKAKAAEDTTHHSCAAHFYFREQSEGLSTFLHAVVTVINQVVEQSSTLCEKIAYEFTRDEVTIDTYNWIDLVKKLLDPAFGEKSKNRLLILLDGVDELDAKERDAFHKFCGIIVENKLNISVVFTARTEFATERQLTNFESIEVTKEKQSSDLKAIIWHRLTTADGLRRFSRYVQQRIADKIEEVSPNMLYAERVLKRYNALGREGAALHDLDRDFPSDINGLYDEMLEECRRRTPEDHRNQVTTLFLWLAYARRPFVLDEIVSLLRYTSKDPKFDLEEIPEPFAKFAQIGDPGARAAAKAVREANGGWGMAIKDLEKTSGATNGNGGGAYDEDGTLPIKFQERSMRSFFQDAPQDASGLRLRQEECYRQIFLICARIAAVIPPGEKAQIDSRVTWYATLHVFYHWNMISPEKHSAQENAEVMEAFAVIMSNQKNFAAMAEWAGLQYETSPSVKELLTKMPGWIELWKQSPQLRSLFKSPDADSQHMSVAWWDAVASGEDGILFALAEGHLKMLHLAKSSSPALKSYKSLRSALVVSKAVKVLDDQAKKNFPSSFEGDAEGGDMTIKKGALGLSHLFDGISMDASAHYAVALILFHYRHLNAAEVTCKAGLAASKQNIEKLRILDLLAQIQHKAHKYDEAQKTVAEFVTDIHDDAMPPGLKRSAMITKARVEVALGNLDAAAESYQTARTLDPENLIRGDVLEEEIAIPKKSNDMKAVIEVIERWNSLERLTWISWDYEDSYSERFLFFREAAAQTGRKDFIVQIFEDAIKQLDNVNAGAPLRCDLAQVYVEVCQDFEAAQKVLDEVFDSNSTGRPYAVTDQSPDYTLERALDLMSDVSFELFRRSKDPEEKKKQLSKMQGLRQRPLAFDVPPAYETFLLHHPITTARMLLKLGPATEFQSTLQRVFGVCIEGLNDSVGWNDTLVMAFFAEALFHLGKAVPQGDKLLWAARILVSAGFSRIDPAKHDEEEDSEDDDESEEESDSEDDEAEEESDADGNPTVGNPTTEEGDLEPRDEVEQKCSGVCNPRAVFWGWRGRVAYQCMTCTYAFLCGPCYEQRMAVNRGDAKFEGREYCGKDHEYLKLPIEGWQGVKDGRLTLTSGESWMFDELLANIKDEICVKGWDSFWDGA